MEKKLLIIDNEDLTEIIEEIAEIAKKKNIELPITEEVYKTIYEGKNPLISFKDLMSREMKMESE